MLKHKIQEENSFYIVYYDFSKPQMPLLPTQTKQVRKKEPLKTLEWHEIQVTETFNKKNF